MVKGSRRPQLKHTRTSRRFFLPPEICAIICDMVADKHDLLSLCRISSAFRSQAERLIYRSVDLRETDGDSMWRLKLWTEAASKHAYLAEYVHSLILQLPISFEPSLASKLTRALAQSVYLKELRILGPREGSRYNFFQGSIINKCSFRLTKFENRYFDDKLILEFWRNQTEILLLNTDRDICALDPESDLLPNLIAVNLKTNNVGDLPAGRALQRVEISTMAHISPLKQYEASLSTLNLRQTHWQYQWLRQPQELALDALVRAVADIVPNLLHLGISDEQKHLSLHHSGISKSSLQRLNKLESFILQMPHVSHFAVMGVSQIPHSVGESAGLFSAGRDIMAACPTLRRVALAANAVQVHGGVLTRSQAEGVIHEEPKTWLQVEALSTLSA
ncbi:hypothetical protein R3P38DRAFT_691448 [Favolaschia claudopus]|uniref:F-box domain-containing protein n=1 Tax=Favolaschia claudopus TaxID=2862362 RepID=A0AAW0EAU7_9AGAR